MSGAEPDWRPAGRLTDFRDGAVAGARFPMDATSELALAIARRGDAVWAFADRCPHRGAPFSQLGIIDDEGHLLCQWHAWAFRLDDGRHTLLPFVCVPTYPVRIDAGVVLVDVNGARRGAEEAS